MSEKGFQLLLDALKSFRKMIKILIYIKSLEQQLFDKQPINQERLYFE